MQDVVNPYAPSRTDTTSQTDIIPREKNPRLLEGAAYGEYDLAPSRLFTAPTRDFEGSDSVTTQTPSEGGSWFGQSGQTQHPTSLRDTIHTSHDLPSYVP